MNLPGAHTGWDAHLTYNPDSPLLFSLEPTLTALTIRIAASFHPLLMPSL